jgi:hypothetical protein
MGGQVWNMIVFHLAFRRRACRRLKVWKNPKVRVDRNNTAITRVQAQRDRHTSAFPSFTITTMTASRLLKSSATLFTQPSARLVGLRSLSSSSPIYVPTLTERRIGEAGTGGRQSEAGLRVAVFGANGFLGRHFCHELGTY